MRPPPEALVFDFDGVLADTEPLYWRAWSSILAHHDVSLTWADYCRIGRGVKDEQMLKSLPELAAQPAVLAAVRESMHERKEMLRKWCAEELPIHTVTVDLLKELRGLRLGLVTSSNQSDVEPMLRRAGIYSCFQSIVFGENVVQHKPHPEPYLLMRQRLGISSGIAFEDSDAGIASATAAGFQAIPVEHPANLPNIVRRVLEQD